MCTSLIGTVRASEKGHEFALCDMHGEPDLPFDKAAVAREIHVVDRQGAVYRGAEAILKILGQYPRWSLVARVGLSPLVRPVLPLGYAVVAANRRFLFGPTSRIFWLKATALIAFCLGLAISSHLLDRPAQLPARAGVERAAGARPPLRLRAVRRPVRTGRRRPDIAAATEIDRRVSGDTCRLLPARPEPLAALDFSLWFSACRAGPVLVAQRGPGWPAGRA
jgi:predicted DCC family thiol-disulfide oxidoreductase YuxK